MWGFGAPDNLGAVTAQLKFDLGWGDPDAAIIGLAPLTEDWGFGDPPPGALTLAFLASAAILPDDGGEIVVLTAVWPIVGPFRVRLINSHSGDTVPIPAVEFGCPGVIQLDRRNRIKEPREPFDCFTDLKLVLAPGEVPPVPGRFLSFVLPPAPPGVYDIEVAWGVNHGDIITLTRLLEVQRRSRAQAQWGVRLIFPSLYASGARTPELETLLVQPELN